MSRFGSNAKLVDKSGQLFIYYTVKTDPAPREIYIPVPIQPKEKFLPENTPIRYVEPQRRVFSLKGYGFDGNGKKMFFYVET